MFRARIAAVCFAVGAGVVSMPVSSAFAQDATSAASAPVSKKALRAQHRAERRAQRKAARAKKNAQLSTLEKNGYNPSEDRQTYPQDLQNAEKRSQGQSVPSTPASP